MVTKLEHIDINKINLRLGIATLNEQEVNIPIKNEFDYVAYSKLKLINSREIFERDLLEGKSPSSSNVKIINSNLEFLCDHIEKTYLNGKPDLDMHKFLSKQAEDLTLISSESLNKGPDQSSTKDVYQLKDVSTKLIGRLVMAERQLPDTNRKNTSDQEFNIN